MRLIEYSYIICQTEMFEDWKIILGIVNFLEHVFLYTTMQFLRRC